MSLNVNDKTIATDEKGYLMNTWDWSEDVAIEIARHDGIVLDPTTWELIFPFTRQAFIIDSFTRLCFSGVVETMLSGQLGHWYRPYQFIEFFSGKDDFIIHWSGPMCRLSDRTRE
jgi:hypothetical protein